MKLHPTITAARVAEAVQRSHRTLDDPGFCIKCGSEAEGVEPDARGYECEACGEDGVYDADDLLLMVAVWWASRSFCGNPVSRATPPGGARPGLCARILSAAISPKMRRPASAARRTLPLPKPIRGSRPPSKPPDAICEEIPGMSRYDIPTRDPGLSAAVGWDNPLQSYFAQVSRPEQADGHDDTMLLWIGAAPREVITLEDLARHLAPFADLCPRGRGPAARRSRSQAWAGPTSVQQTLLSIVGKTR